jgi:hypothetical protein
MAIQQVSASPLTSFEYIPLTAFSDPNTVINFGATFAGVLHFRGFVMESIHSQKPLTGWPVQAILSLFVSGTDPHRSFCKYFIQTRTRLLHSGCERIAKRGTGVQAAYLLACLEYAQVGHVFDKNNPTKNMLLFAKLLQNRPAQYLIQDQARNKAMRRELPQVLASARNSAAWRKDDRLLESVCEFLKPPPEKTEKHKKKSRGRNKGKGKAKSEDEVAARRMEETFSAPAAIVANIRQNPLLDALAQPMPGVNVVDSSDLEMEADTADRASRLAPNLAHVDDDDDAVPVADFGDEVTNLARALDALEMIHTRGDVVLEEGDEVSFEQAIQQRGPQGVTSGVDGVIEVKL